MLVFIKRVVSCVWTSSWTSTYLWDVPSQFNFSKTLFSKQSLVLLQDGLERRGFKEVGFLNAVAEVASTGNLVISMCFCMFPQYLV